MAGEGTTRFLVSQEEASSCLWGLFPGKTAQWWWVTAVEGQGERTACPGAGGVFGTRAVALADMPTGLTPSPTVWGASTLAASAQ